jgi:hypothetical protein
MTSRGSVDSSGQTRRGKRRSSFTFFSLAFAMTAAWTCATAQPAQAREQAAQSGGETPAASGTPTPAAEGGSATPTPPGPVDSTSATSSAAPTPTPPSSGAATQSAPAPPQPAPEPPAPEPAAHPSHGSHTPGAHLGQGRRGFVVSASFGVRPYFTHTLNAASVATEMTTALQGGLGIGFKTGRVVLTVGLDIGSIDVRDTFTYRTTATFLIVPGLQVAIARSRDHRVELVGSVRLGAGSTMSTDATSIARPPALVMYELAPAVRYWAHRQFAVQFLAGYGGEYQISSGSVGNTSIGRHGLAASIGTIGIF